MVPQRDRRAITNSKRLAAAALAMATGISGCFDWSSLSKPQADPAAVAADTAGAEVAAGEDVTRQPLNTDPFATVELEAGQKPFLDAARPFILAMSQRDYAAAFTHLSPTAKHRFSRNQFIPTADEQQYAKHEAEPILNPTAEQFVQLMQEVEGLYGTPARLDPPTVDTDPDTLSRQDPVSAAYMIGAMPDTIPVEQRKAAVVTWIYCQPTDEQIKQRALDDGVDEAEYRQELADALAGGEGPYFKLKTLVIDAGAGPVVGYLEIAPPGLLD